MMLAFASCCLPIVHPGILRYVGALVVDMMVLVADMRACAVLCTCGIKACRV